MQLRKVVLLNMNRNMHTWRSNRSVPLPQCTSLLYMYNMCRDSLNTCFVDVLWVYIGEAHIVGQSTTLWSSGNCHAHLLFARIAVLASSVYVLFSNYLFMPPLNTVDQTGLFILYFTAIYSLLFMYPAFWNQLRTCWICYIAMVTIQLFYKHRNVFIDSFSLP